MSSPKKGEHPVKLYIIKFYSKYKITPKENISALVSYS